MGLFSSIIKPVQRVGLCLNVVGLVFLCTSSVTHAQSVETRLSAAEAQIATAQQQITAATADISQAEGRLNRIAPKADRANAAAAALLAEVEAVEGALIDQRTAALEEIRRLETDYDDEKASHDDAVGFGLGAGIALLLLAAITLAWGWFRQIPVVERFSYLSGWRPWAITAGGLLGGLIVSGALLEGEQALRILGSFLLFLALGLAAALLVARHSLRVERNEEQSLVSRRRFPRWSLIVTAVLLFLFGASSLGDAVTSENPEPPKIAGETRELAEAAEDDPLDPPTEELLAARAASEPLVARSEELNSLRDEAEASLAQARQGLRSGQKALRKAKLATNRLSAQVARETAREAREQARSAPSPSSGGGSPGGSYTNCDNAPSDIPVPPGSPLDGDGDGIGCES